MPPVLKVAAFIAQSVAIGLALAFIAVLVRPDLINRTTSATATQSSYAQAVAASAAAVANISAERIYDAQRIRPGLTLRRQELGSGVVIDRAGYVVTNYHVI